MSMKEMLSEENTDEYLCCGNSACAGCTSELALRWALKALGPKTVVVAPASCTNVYIGLWPAASPNVPFINMALPQVALLHRVSLQDSRHLGRRASPS